MPVEVKLNDTKPSAHWKKFLSVLPCKRGIQLVFPKTWKIHTDNELQVLVAGATEVLSYFPLRGVSVIKVEEYKGAPTGGIKSSFKRATYPKKCEEIAVKMREVMCIVRRQ